MLRTAVVTGLLLALLTGTRFLSGERSTEEPPNVVFIMIDDLGYTDVNPYALQADQYYETPNITRLAGQGMTFTNAYTNAANCAPTRASLMSGQYYPRQPIYHVGSPSQGELIPAENATHLPTSKTTIAEALEQANYVSASIGKWHIGEPPETGPTQQGFDVNVGGYLAGNPGVWEGGYFQPNNNPYIEDADDDEYLTDYLTRNAIAFIREHRENPFYLNLSYYTPHSPFQAPEELVRKYERKDPDRGHSHPTYAAMVESMDRQVGRLLDGLEALGLADNTVIVFTSDNGGLSTAEGSPTSNLPLRGGKGWVYEGGIREPFIIRWPGVAAAGARSDAPVMSIDFFPTLLEIAGAPEQFLEAVDGESLVPLLEGSGDLTRDALYWHYPHYSNQGGFPGGAIRVGSWKLIERYEDGAVQLHNLELDAGETQDLSGDRADLVDDLRARLHTWYQEVGAKFLQPLDGGPMPWRP